MQLSSPSLSHPAPAAAASTYSCRARLGRRRLRHAALTQTRLCVAQAHTETPATSSISHSAPTDQYADVLAPPSHWTSNAPIAQFVGDSSTQAAQSAAPPRVPPLATHHQQQQRLSRRTSTRPTPLSWETTAHLDVLQPGHSVQGAGNRTWPYVRARPTRSVGSQAGFINKMLRLHGRVLMECSGDISTFTAIRVLRCAKTMLQAEEAHMPAWLPSVVRPPHSALRGRHLHHRAKRRHTQCLVLQRSQHSTHIAAHTQHGHGKLGGSTLRGRVARAVPQGPYKHLLQLVHAGSIPKTLAARQVAAGWPNVPTDRYLIHVRKLLSGPIIPSATIHVPKVGCPSWIAFHILQHYMPLHQDHRHPNRNSPHCSNTETGSSSSSSRRSERRSSDACRSGGSVGSDKVRSSGNSARSRVGYNHSSGGVVDVRSSITARVSAGSGSSGMSAPNLAWSDSGAVCHGVRMSNSVSAGRSRESASKDGRASSWDISSVNKSKDGSANKSTDGSSASRDDRSSRAVQGSQSGVLCLSSFGPIAAVNSLKGVAVARRHLRKSGRDVCVVLEVVSVDIDSAREGSTAMNRFMVMECAMGDPTQRLYVKGSAWIRSTPTQLTGIAPL